MADMTLEEALAAATVDEELISPVNEVLMINPETRTINVPDSEKMFGARQDMGVERKYFKCPRIVGDNIDLFEHRIFVNYVPSKQDGSYDAKEEVQCYWCRDLAVEGDFVTFSWKLSENVTRSAGYIAFAVYAKTIDEYGNLQTKWHTTIAIGNVLDTLPDGEEWITVYPDIVMQLLERMDEVEKNGGNGTSDAVQYIKQTLTEEQQIQARTNIGAASANEVSKLSEEIGLITTKIVDISKQFSVGKTYNFNTENGSISDALSDVITLSQGSYFGYVNITVENLNYSNNGAIYLQWLHTINATCDERHAGAVSEYPLKNGEIELFGSFTVDSGMVKAVLTRKGGTGNFSFDFTVNKLYLLENVTSDDVIETIRKKEYNEKLMSVVIDDNSITAKKLSEDLIDKFSSGNDLVIDCWGDSLTAGTGSTNYPYPTKLQELIGNSVVVNNYGEGGDNANDVAFRQGALGAIVQPFKVGSEASDFNYIEFSAINGSDISKMSMSGAYHGNGFVYLDGTDKYMFRQSGDGAYLLVGEGRLLGKTYTRPIFMNAEGKGTRHIIIICIGQNGWHDSNVDHLADIISLMIQHNNYEKYIIVGRPTGDKTSRNEEETVLGTRFGNKFVNAREYISSCGLSENSLEATNDDFTAMANGAIPPQLLSDEVHLNDYGYISMANCIYQRGKILDYWS